MTTTNQAEEETKTSNEAPDDAGTAQKKVSPAGRIVFLIITALCFVYLYYRLNGAAAREDLSLVAYMLSLIHI